MRMCGIWYRHVKRREEEVERRSVGESKKTRTHCGGSYENDEHKGEGRRVYDCQEGKRLIAYPAT